MSLSSKIGDFRAGQLKWNKLVRLPNFMHFWKPDFVLHFQGQTIVHMTIISIDLFVGFNYKVEKYLGFWIIRTEYIFLWNTLLWWPPFWFEIWYAKFHSFLRKIGKLFQTVLRKKCWNLNISCTNKFRWFLCCLTKEKKYLWRYKINECDMISYITSWVSVTNLWKDSIILPWSSSAV